MADTPSPDADGNAGGVVLLTRFGARGVPGLVDLQLDLGPMTAVIGPGGSGKSRLLQAVAWLMRGGSDAGDDRLGIGAQVSGVLDGASGPVRLSRDGSGRLEIGSNDPALGLPACTFLRARHRLNPPGEDDAVGIAGRIARAPSRHTTDASAAEAMLAVVEECCLGGTTRQILLIEEPELMLTPQAQRYLYGLLRRFADENQVVYSTRSPALLDAAYHHEIVRLDRTVDGVRVRRAPTELLSDGERLRLAAEFDHERSEMFFASAVVLVEGQTERLSLPSVFRAFGQDPDAAGISIVEVGGKANLPIAARILRELDIPFLVVFDTDRGRPGAQLNERIRAIAVPRLAIGLDPDFEAVAGIRSHQEKVLHAWRRFAGPSPEPVPPLLAEVVRRAIELAG